MISERLEQIAAKASRGPYENQGSERGKRRIACAPDENGHRHTLCNVQHFNSRANAALLIELLNNLPTIIEALRKNGD